MKRCLVMLGLATAAFALAYAATKRWNAPPSGPAGMVWIPGGHFTMGTDSDLGWPDEKPARGVRVTVWNWPSNSSRTAYRTWSPARRSRARTQRPSLWLFQ